MLYTEDGDGSATLSLSHEREMFSVFSGGKTLVMVITVFFKIVCAEKEFTTCSFSSVHTEKKAKRKNSQVAHRY